MKHISILIVVLLAATTATAAESPRPNHSIRSRDWRLVVYEDGAEELYDHRTDPDEFQNLAGDPAHKAKRDQLARWLPDNAASEFKTKSERSRARAK